MPEVYKNCQSCGMPLKRDPEHGGTNADGTKSTMYCSYCYASGAFKGGDMTAEQMQAFCKKKLQEMGYPGFLAGWMTKWIPSLKRWKKD